MGEKVNPARDATHLGRIVGDLSGLSLVEIIQMLSLGGRTGSVALVSGDRSGRIWFVRGAATHAEAGSKAGTPAVYEMLAWKEGRFVIEDGVLTEAQTLDCDTMLMVLEGVRLIDEENAPAIVESEVREVEPVPEAEDGPIRSKRRRFTVMLGISIVVSMTAASFVGLPFVFPGLDTEPVEPVTVAGRGAPISPIMLASREDRPTAPTPLYLDRPEFWILQMSASTTAPEADQTTESVSHRADAIGSPDPGPAIHTPVVEQEVVEDPPVPTLEGPFPQSVEFPVSIEPGYVDLIVKSSVKSGLLVVEIDGQSVYSQPLQKKAKSVKRFLNKMTGQADERFHTTLEVEPGPHEILALVEIHGKKVRYESRLEVELDSGGRETIEVSLGRVFGKRLAMAVVDPAVSEEIIE